MHRVENASVQRARYKRFPTKANAAETVELVLSDLVIERPRDIVDLVHVCSSSLPRHTPVPSFPESDLISPHPVTLTRRGMTPPSRHTFAPSHSWSWSWSCSQLLGRGTQVDLAIAVYKRFAEVDGRPFADPSLYEAAVTACCRNMRHALCLSVLNDMKRLDLTASTFTYNMVIQACAQAGDADSAFNAWRQMQERDVAPNSFTLSSLLHACRHLPQQEPFMKAALIWHAAREGDLLDAEGLGSSFAQLYGLAVGRCTSSPAVEDLFGVVDSQQHLDTLSADVQTEVFTLTIEKFADLRDAEASTSFFTLSLERGLRATTRMYAALIRAAVRGGEIWSALELFEWMVQGRGNDGDPIVADAEIYEILLQACHQRGLLEKGAEVFGWMLSSGIKASTKALNELSMTAELAELWDKKVQHMADAERAKINEWLQAGEEEMVAEDSKLRELIPSLMTLPALCDPSLLRPSIYDGMRQVYLDDAASRLEEERLAAPKLGVGSWAPAELRPAPNQAHAKNPAQTRPQDKSRAELASEETQGQRLSRDTMTSWLPSLHRFGRERSWDDMAEQRVSSPALPAHPGAPGAPVMPGLALDVGLRSSATFGGFGVGDPTTPSERASMAMSVSRSPSPPTPGARRSGRVEMEVSRGREGPGMTSLPSPMSGASSPKERVRGKAREPVSLANRRQGQKNGVVEFALRSSSEVTLSSDLPVLAERQGSARFGRRLHGSKNTGQPFRPNPIGDSVS